MSRREFVRLGLATLIATGAGKLRPAFARTLAPGQDLGSLSHPMVASGAKASTRAADFMLRIAPMIVELAPHVAISTIGYSDKIPGPLLRVREGQRVAVEVINDTDVPEFVHWHGLVLVCMRRDTGRHRRNGYSTGYRATWRRHEQVEARKVLEPLPLAERSATPTPKLVACLRTVHEPRQWLCARGSC